MSTKPFVACSSCFSNEGLRLDAERLGQNISSPCPRCSATESRKLTSSYLSILCQEFFVWGSAPKLPYGAAPWLQFNKHNKTDPDLKDMLIEDVAIFEDVLGIGFFFYGPRLWMIGEIEPLKKLRNAEMRTTVIDRILCEYESRIFTVNDKFYRVRKNPSEPSRCKEYDSPPITKNKEEENNRLGTPELPVLYASPDLQTCLHECRVIAEDDLFVATLRPTRSLKMLDLTIVLDEPKEVSEFESLDLAVCRLFLAGKHSYSITRELATMAHKTGFDGLIFPSYFSMLRSGVRPIEATYGIAHRMIPRLREFEKAKIFPNIAVFGRPIQERLIKVSCINRVVLTSVSYSFHFGPVFERDIGNGS